MKYTKDFFFSEFLPNLEKRMNNPDYPNTCIITQKQFFVCKNFMTLANEIKQKKSGEYYSHLFYECHIPESGRIKRFRISMNKKYIFLNRDYVDSAFDFLFAFNENSEYEGECFLVEAFNIQEAIKILTDKYNFNPTEFNFIERLSVEEGEQLGLDTY